MTRVTFKTGMASLIILGALGVGMGCGVTKISWWPWGKNQPPGATVNNAPTPAPRARRLERRLDEEPLGDGSFVWLGALLRRLLWRLRGLRVLAHAVERGREAACRRERAGVVLAQHARLRRDPRLGARRPRADRDATKRTCVPVCCDPRRCHKSYMSVGRR